MVGKRVCESLVLLRTVVASSIFVSQKPTMGAFPGVRASMFAVAKLAVVAFTVTGMIGPVSTIGFIIRILFIEVLPESV
jgi:hypothetical protein